MEGHAKGIKDNLLPDIDVFDTIEVNFDMVSKRLRELAYLNGGVTFTLEDNRSKGENRSREFHYKGGIRDFVKELNLDKTRIYDDPIYVRGSKDGIIVEWQCSIMTDMLRIFFLR